MSAIEKFWMGVVFMALLASISFAAGYGHVKKQWDADKKVKAALIKQAEDNATDIARGLNEAWQEELKNGKSKAADAAVRWFIKSHGLLPDGTPVRGCGSTPGDSGAKVSDGTPGEPGARTSLEEFAVRCGHDANRLSDWQALCKSQPNSCKVLD